MDLHRILAPESTNQYLWLVFIGGIGSVFCAFGIGANDVANSFATSVGAKSISIKNAIKLACLCELSGAILMGSHVTSTLIDVADIDLFKENPGALIYGMSCAVWASGFWLLLATYLELPVSTTQSTIGGIIGMAMVAQGKNDVNWGEKTDTFPFLGGMTSIFLSWIISPVLSAAASVTLFMLVRTVILRADDSYSRGLVFFPLLVAITLTVNIFFIVYKGGGGIDVSVEAACAIAFGFGFGIALLMIPTVLPHVRKRVDRKFASDFEKESPLKKVSSNGTVVIAPHYAAHFSTSGSDMEAGAPTTTMTITAAAVAGAYGPSSSSLSTAAASAASQGILNDTTMFGDKTAPVSSIEYGKGLSGYMNRSLNIDPHDVVRQSNYVSHIHDNAEDFEPKTEELFKSIQVFTAMCDSFAHGANDVANAIAPFTVIYLTYKTGTVEDVVNTSTNSYWILALGGLGIVVGIVIYGYKIISAIGVKIAKITPSRGFAIELGTAIVILMGTRLSIPLSTTHCQIGSTMGVAALEGKAGVNWIVICKTLLGWVLTLVVVGLTSAALFAQGYYAPSP